MKLATYNDGSRDGQLAVVSRDLHSAHFATGIATRLQELLDDWNFLSPQLEDLAQTLNQGKARHAFAFDPKRCMAPLPRAYQWADGSAFANHIDLLSRAAGTEAPADFMDDPRVYQGGSDDFQKQIELAKLDAMFAVCETAECRRVLLLRHFGEEGIAGLVHDVGVPGRFDERKAQAGRQVEVMGRLGLIHGVLKKKRGQQIRAHKRTRRRARKARTEVPGSRSLSSGL